MKINRKLLPIKLHFFFFMAAMGPILPQVQVYGKELGISSLVMGTITGILPFTFLLMKPIFGLIVDIYRNFRKLIFILLIVIMTASFAAIYFIPPKNKFESYQDFPKKCLKNSTFFDVLCTSSCFPFETTFKGAINNNHFEICNINNTTVKQIKCQFTCVDNDNSSLYKSFTFWSFILLMSVGTIGFNVINSITDAICFDVVGDEYDYGKQRVWGTIGFGLTALISGYMIDKTSTYTPAFIIMAICSLLDLIACYKLKLPVIPAPENVWQDLKTIFVSKRVVIFMLFTIFAGVIDSILIYYLFWYLEDWAVKVGTQNVKLLEGLIIAAETLGGEVVFFSLSGKIINYLGHVHCFTICFVNYCLRFLLISLAPSPWWVLPIEFFMQGPTYALTYTTIVAYANKLAPLGMSATMQGIAAGMSEGTGYAIGSILGGLTYKLFAGQLTFKIFSIFALVCACLHLLLTRNQHSPAEDYESL